jgi:hypothetical protein
MAVTDTGAKGRQGVFRAQRTVAAVGGDEALGLEIIKKRHGRFSVSSTPKFSS